MYRDDSRPVDERDPAVDALLIAEGLLEQCERVTSLPPDARWKALADAHAAIPAIWQQLDRARASLAERGKNTATYDELRPSARRTSPRIDHIERDALDDAKRGVAALKVALPGADWHAIAARTAGLATTPLDTHRRTLLIGAGIAGVFAVAAVVIVVAPRKEMNRDPEPDPPPAPTLRAQPAPPPVAAPVPVVTPPPADPGLPSRIACTVKDRGDDRLVSQRELARLDRTCTIDWETETAVLVHDVPDKYVLGRWTRSHNYLTNEGRDRTACREEVARRTAHVIAVAATGIKDARVEFRVDGFRCGDAAPRPRCRKGEEDDPDSNCRRRFD
ncbi:MAG TPA: hypothetical protein VLB44_12580 [Kofleriaceae bacterium]|nr:hypothetical protein [Kofleriaceae bacterium]